MYAIFNYRFPLKQTNCEQLQMYDVCSKKTKCKCTKINYWLLGKTAFVRVLKESR